MAAQNALGQTCDVTREAMRDNAESDEMETKDLE